MATQKAARASPELRNAQLSPRYRRNYTTPWDATSADNSRVNFGKTKTPLACLLFCINNRVELPLVERLPYFTRDSIDVVNFRRRALNTTDVGKQAMLYFIVIFWK